MRKLLTAAILTALAAPALADVGVSVNVNEPGFYGQINIGSVPQPPQVIYAQPVVVQRTPAYVAEPIYLHVPPGHEKHWSKHCAEYNACGRPVYFVREDWYNREYAPRHGHDDDQGHGREHGHGHDHDHDHND
jgi:hypothetical protein